MSVERIVFLYAQRRAAVKADTALTLQIKAIMRNLQKGEAGQSLDNPTRIASPEELGEDQALTDAHTLSALAEPLTRPFMEARIPVRKYRRKCEKEMAEIVESLPIAGWIKEIRGIGAIGAALVIGAAGRDLDQYGNPGKLWKRFGLAPGQRRTTDVEKAIEMGYSPARRSVAYNLSESLMKQNDGEYRKLYLDRKAYLKERSPDWKDGKVHKEALRYLAKRFLRDMWRAWRGQKSVVHLMKNASPEQMTGTG